jgi:hypothetical protein
MGWKRTGNGFSPTRSILSYSARSSPSLWSLAWKLSSLDRFFCRAGTRSSEVQMGGNFFRFLRFEGCVK